MNFDISERKEKAYFPPNKTCLKSDLYGAGHCAEGEHSSTVLYSGLAVKSSLSVNEEHSNLLGQDTHLVFVFRLNFKRFSQKTFQPHVTTFSHEAPKN